MTFRVLCQLKYQAVESGHYGIVIYAFCVVFLYPGSVYKTAVFVCPSTWYHFLSRAAGLVPDRACTAYLESNKARKVYSTYLPSSVSEIYEDLHDHFSTSTHQEWIKEVCVLNMDTLTTNINTRTTGTKKLFAQHHKFTGQVHADYAVVLAGNATLTRQKLISLIIYFKAASDH